jgi:hypothetical protein
MKRQVKTGGHEAASRAGGKRGAWRQFSLGLLGGLMFLGLLGGAGVQVFAGPEQNAPATHGMLATLSLQVREAVAEGARFASDVRLLYQISNLQPVAPQDAISVDVPAPVEKTDCSLISSKGSAADLRKARKSRS